jgi:hypothetical protein
MMESRVEEQPPAAGHSPLSAGDEPKQNGVETRAALPAGTIYLTGMQMVDGHLDWSVSADPRNGFDNLIIRLLVGNGIDGLAVPHRREALTLAAQMLSKGKVSWLRPGRERWTLDCGELSGELGLSLAPDWFHGRMSIKPEVETDERVIFEETRKETFVTLYVERTEGAESRDKGNVIEDVHRLAKHFLQALTADRETEKGFAPIIGAVEDIVKYTSTWPKPLTKELMDSSMALIDKSFESWKVKQMPNLRPLELGIFELEQQLVVKTNKARELSDRKFARTVTACRKRTAALEGGSAKGLAEHTTPFVDLTRIAELRSASSAQFDMRKLVKLCEELNVCYAHECYFAVAMLTRAVLDHVAPMFNCKSFAEVASNYGGAGKSFKSSMQHLEKSLRNIADSCLHLQIRDKESLPNKTQISFMNDLDVLLAEIVRILSK